MITASQGVKVMLKKLCKCFIIVLIVLFSQTAFCGELTKETIVGLIEVTRTGHIQVRQSILIFEDGKEISKQYHRYVLSPGDDLTGQPDRVRRVAEAVWNQYVLDRFSDIKDGKSVPFIPEDIKVKEK